MKYLDEYNNIVSADAKISQFRYNKHYWKTCHGVCRDIEKKYILYYIFCYFLQFYIPIYDDTLHYYMYH